MTCPTSEKVSYCFVLGQMEGDDVEDCNPQMNPKKIPDEVWDLQRSMLTEDGSEVLDVTWLGYYKTEAEAVTIRDTMVAALKYTGVTVHPESVITGEED
jgi:hypothetical protein